MGRETKIKKMRTHYGLLHSASPSQHSWGGFSITISDNLSRCFSPKDLIFAQILQFFALWRICFPEGGASGTACACRTASPCIRAPTRSGGPRPAKRESIPSGHRGVCRRFGAPFLHKIKRTLRPGKKAASPALIAWRKSPRFSCILVHGMVSFIQVNHSGSANILLLLPSP